MNTVLRYSNVFNLHQHVCLNNGDTMVRTSRLHSSNFSCLQLIFTIWSFARKPQFFVVGKNRYESLAPVYVGPACPLLQ